MGGISDESQRRGRGRASKRRFAAGAGTLAIHALILLAVMHTWGTTPPIVETPAIEVMLVPPPQPPPPPPVVLPVGEPAPAAPAQAPGPPTEEPPKPAKPKPPPTPHRIVKHIEPSEVPPRVVPPEPAPPLSEVSVSAADLASATTAESEAAGGGGGAGDSQGMGGGGAGNGQGGRCDMVARIQRKLRNDPSVRSALSRARRAPGFEGRPLMIWNGDWVRHGEEDGKGLASLRQAIAVEVAFAPKSCRSQAMRGLVLLSLADGPGSGRVVLGTRAWRWSDLALR